MRSMKLKFAWLKTPKFDILSAYFIHIFSPEFFEVLKMSIGENWKNAARVICLTAAALATQACAAQVLTGSSSLHPPVSGIDEPGMVRPEGKVYPLSGFVPEKTTVVAAINGDESVVETRLKNGWVSRLFVYGTSINQTLTSTDGIQRSNQFNVVKDQLVFNYETTKSRPIDPPSVRSPDYQPGGLMPAQVVEKDLANYGWQELVKEQAKLRQDFTTWQSTTSTGAFNNEQTIKVSCTPGASYGWGGGGFPVSIGRGAMVSTSGELGVMSGYVTDRNVFLRGVNGNTYLQGDGIIDGSSLFPQALITHMTEGYPGKTRDTLLEPPSNPRTITQEQGSPQSVVRGSISAVQQMQLSLMQAAGVAVAYSGCLNIRTDNSEGMYKTGTYKYSLNTGKVTPVKTPKVTNYAPQSGYAP